MGDLGDTQGVASLNAALVSANMVSEAQAAAMRERAAATYLAMGSAADTFAGQARNGAMAAQQVGFQLNDIGVMLAGGMSPLSIAVTQGTQLAQTFQGLKGSTSILSTLAGGFAAMFSPVSERGALRPHRYAGTE
jgi:hypothetical protein